MRPTNENKRQQSHGEASSDAATTMTDVNIFPRTPALCQKNTDIRGKRPEPKVVKNARMSIQGRAKYGQGETQFSRPYSLRTKRRGTTHTRTYHTFFAKVGSSDNIQHPFQPSYTVSPIHSISSCRPRSPLSSNRRECSDGSTVRGRGIRGRCCVVHVS